MYNRFDYIQKKLHISLTDKTVIKLLGGKNSKLYKDVYTLLMSPVTSYDVIRERMKHKIWRLNYCYNIVDKRTEVVPFVMTAAQFKVYLAMLKHNRIINLKSRQQGISTLWVVSFTDDCLYKPNVLSAMISLGNDQQHGMLRRADFVWENTEEWAKKLFGVTKISKDKKRDIEFSNSSMLMIGNKFRGDTLTNLHVSELGSIADENPAKAKDIMLGSVQTVGKEGRVVIESTAFGENMFSDLYRDAEATLASGREEFSTDEFYPVFLSWLEDPYCNEDVYQEETEAFRKYRLELKEQNIDLTETQKNFWIAKYKVANEGIYAEYPATVNDAFRVSNEGAILAKHYMEFAHRNEQFPIPYSEYNWRPEEPVYVAFDLGVSDPTFMIWMQVIDGKLLIIREKIFNPPGQKVKSGLREFSQYLHRFSAKNVDRGPDDEAYKYESLIWPHDGVVRNLGNEVEKRSDIMSAKGWRIDISPSKDYKDIALIMEVMQHMYIFPERTPLLHKALLNYSRKYNKTEGVFRDEPKHDDASHPIDALRYGIAQLYNQIIKPKRKLDKPRIPPV